MERQRIFPAVCSIAMIAVLGIAFSTCGGGGGGGGGYIPPSNTLTVRVTNDSGGGTVVPKATVVLGDSTGAMITSATTNTEGLVTFYNPPRNATITAMVQKVQVPWNTLQWQYSLAAAYDVNVPRITLSLDVMKKIGEANVNVYVYPGTFSVDHWHIYPGWVEGNGSSNPTAVNVYEGSIRKDDRKISFVVIGEDTSNDPVAYGKLLDQTFDPAIVSTYTVTIDTAFTYFTTMVSKVHSSADYLYSDMGMQEQRSFTVSTNKTFGPAETSLEIPSIAFAGHGDSFSYTAAAGKDLYKGMYGGYLEGQDTWLYGTSRMTTTALGSPQTVDLDPALHPAIPEVLWINGAGTKRPMMSWNGRDASADVREIEIQYQTAFEQYRYRLLLPATRTNVTFPELPDLSDWFDFPPVWLSRFAVTTSSYKNSLVAGYDDYLRKTDNILSGAMPMPDDVTVKVSRAEKNFNAVLKGEYEISRFYYNTVQYGASRISATFNGEGRMDYTVLENSSPPHASGPGRYVLSPYHVMTLLYDMDSDGAGVLLPNYGMFVTSNADPARDRVFEVGVKKSTAVTPTFTGPYVFSQIGKNAAGLYSSQVELVSSGSGTGTWAIQYHSQGATGNGTFEYSLASDGTLRVTRKDGSENVISVDQGMVASEVTYPTSNMIVLVDASAGSDGDNDGEIMLAVGIKKSVSRPFDPGYYVNFFGADSGTPFAARASAAWDAAHSELDCTVLADSRAYPPWPAFSAPVTVSATDNTFFIEGGDQGVLDPDGSFFVVIDPTAGSAKLIVGVRH